ncbi:MAG: hypothetical protein M3322_00655 [Actinomycetota bacterium]|nr:hypothetical protein [Actinomycetota bacterium]
MRAVDLALYADTLAAEAAALSARAERCRSRLRQAAIERRARAELRPEIVARLDALGVFSAADELATREEIRDLAVSLAALGELQVWVERCLAADEERIGDDGWGAADV